VRSGPRFAATGERPDLPTQRRLRSPRNRSNLGNRNCCNRSHRRRWRATLQHSCPMRALQPIASVAPCPIPQHWPQRALPALARAMRCRSAAQPRGCRNWCAVSPLRPSRRGGRNNHTGAGQQCRLAARTGRAGALVRQHDVQSATLRLSPEHLGPVEVQIDVQKSQVNVNFSAASAETRTALGADCAAIARDIRQRRLTLGHTMCRPTRDLVHNLRRCRFETALAHAQTVEPVAGRGDPDARPGRRVRLNVPPGQRQFSVAIASSRWHKTLCSGSGTPHQPSAN